MAASDKKGEKKASQFNAFLDSKYIPLDNKIKLAIAIGVVIAPIVLFYLFMYSPNVKKIEGFTRQKQSLSAEIAKAKKAAGELKKMEAEKAKTEELFKETAKILPKTKEIPDLLRNISDLGKNAGLDFQSFKPGGENPKAFYAEIPVDIAIVGPYHNLGYFLDKVSKLERLVTVDNIKMGGAKKEGTEMLLKSSCRLKTYRFTGVQKKAPAKGRGRGH